MSDVVLPGARDVRGTLEDPRFDESSVDGVHSERVNREPKAERSEAVVVACPPHPQHGGHRGDRRLVAVGDALNERGIACLRFDYGTWDEGYGEREDTRNAIRWASDRYDRVAVFGFSFGAAQAILASSTVDRDVHAVSVLAPPTQLTTDLAVLPALEALECPVQVLYGTRDTTVDAEPVADVARDRGGTVTEFSADHFFIGQHVKVAREVATFLTAHLE